MISIYFYVLLQIICQRESVNLTVKFKECLYFKDGGKENETECIIYKNFTSVASKGSYDLEAHISSAKHTHTKIQICHNAPRSWNFL
jgi:hypothetical protein